MTDAADGSAEPAHGFDGDNREPVGLGFAQQALFDVYEHTSAVANVILEVPQPTAPADVPPVDDAIRDVTGSASDVLAEMRGGLQALPIRASTMLALEETVFADEVRANSVPEALARLLQVDRP